MSIPEPASNPPAENTAALSQPPADALPAVPLADTAPSPEALGLAPPISPEEAWEGLDLTERLFFILNRVKPEHWFEDDYLPVLISFCTKSVVWARIKARFRELRGNPWDLQKIANDVIAAEKETRLAEIAAAEGEPAAAPALAAAGSGRKLRSTDGSRIATRLAMDYRPTLALSLDDQRWYRYQPDHGLWRPEPLLKVRARLRESIATLEPGADFAWSLVSDVEKFLQTALYREFPRGGGPRIPFANGALNLKTMTLEDHAPKHGFRWALPYAYTPDATCEHVQQWLTDFVHGDAQMVQILRAYARAVVCGRADLRRFLALVGSSGSGKSTYVRFLQALVGMPNTVATEIRQLETNRFELSGLLEKRLIVLSDVGHYVGEANILKAITGGDVLRVETKHVDRKETPAAFCEGLVVVVSEHAVQSTDYSAGLEARRISIPTRGRVARPVPMLDYDHQRGTFSGKLVSDLPGVFPWLFAMSDAAMEETLRAGVHQHPSLRKAQVEAILETNPLMRWADATLALWTPQEREAYADKTPTAPTPLQIGVARKCDRGVNAYECEDVWLYPSYRRYADDTGGAHLALQRFTGLLINVLAEQLRLPGIERLPHGKHGSRLCGLRFRKVSDNAEDKPTLRLSQEYTALNSPGEGPGADFVHPGADGSREGADFSRIEDDSDGLYDRNGDDATRTRTRRTGAHMEINTHAKSAKSPSPSSPTPRKSITSLPPVHHLSITGEVHPGEDAATAPAPSTPGSAPPAGLRCPESATGQHTMRAGRCIWCTPKEGVS